MTHPGHLALLPLPPLDTLRPPRHLEPLPTRTTLASPSPGSRQLSSRLSTRKNSETAVSHQLMAIFGWDTLKMAEAYTRAADQQRLAQSAMHMLDTQEQNSTESCPTEAPGGTFFRKNVNGTP